MFSFLLHEICHLHDKPSLHSEIFISPSFQIAENLVNYSGRSQKNLFLQLKFKFPFEKNFEKVQNSWV